MTEENTTPQPKKVSRRRKKAAPKPAFEEQMNDLQFEVVEPAAIKVPETLEVKEDEEKEVDKVIEELFNESVLEPVQPWKKKVRPMAPLVDPNAPQRGVRKRF